MTRRLIPLAAVALMLAAFGPMIQGDPIPGRDIVLEEDPLHALTTGTTDRRGQVSLPVQPGRRYTIQLPDFARAPYTGVARVEVGRMVMNSVPLAPGGPAPAYFMGRDGRRMTLTIPRGVERVRLTLTEGPVPGPASPRG